MVGDSCDLSNSLKSELGLSTSDFQLRLVNKLGRPVYIYQDRDLETTINEG